MPPPSQEPPQAPGEGLQTLQGLIDGTTFANEETGYAVLRILPEEGFETPGESGSLFAKVRTVAVGKLLGAAEAEGHRYSFQGRWTRHAVHGLQFEFESARPLEPVDESGMVRYLASKTFPGIGEALAQRIVERLGMDALERIREDASCLEGIRGLRPDVRATLVESVKTHHARHRSIAFLMGLGLGPVQSQKVLVSLGPEAESLLRADPYALMQVPQMGFRMADRVALAMELEPDDPRRLVAALEFCLGRSADDGHSMIRLGDLRIATQDLLQGAAREQDLNEALEQLVAKRRCVIDRGQLPEDTDLHHAEHPVYLPWLFHSEQSLARNLARLLRVGEVEPLARKADLAEAEERAGIELHPDQRAAVLGLLASPVGILTGGPGVGKTTIVRLIADLASRAGYEVLLASPTGRAAKRLAEATGRQASTIHRLLKAQPPDGFEHDDKNPLRAGLVLVDEISMLDVALAHHLVKAINAPTRLVLVGDPDQLPSVGAGNVLADLLGSGCIPTHRLNQVFRQDQESLIVANAHRVLDGDLPTRPAAGDTKNDFYVFTAEDERTAADRLIEVVTQRIPRTFGFDWLEDVQVIAPMYKGECGVDALNERLREAAGFGGREVERGGRSWRVGDRVIQTRNDYEKEVFNGDMGRICDVSSDGTVTIAFPEQRVSYSGGELSDLRPAFAITVHRSQGGEFPCVVVPLVPSHRMMLQRNLLYTAITRAKQLVVLVGSDWALKVAVETADQALRSSLLKERLMSSCDAD